MKKRLGKPGKSFPVLWVLVIGLAAGSAMTMGAGISMQVTDQRPFCAGCHIMNEAAVTHKMSSHAGLSCNECHAPRNLVEKMPFKAMSGTRDMYMNTFGRVQMPLQSGEATKKVVNDNCKACHHMSNTTVASTAVKAACTDCHRNVHHMRMKPVSTRSVGDV